MNKADLFEFFQAINDIEKGYEEIAKQAGISYNELAIFHMLYNHAPCTQKNIADTWRLPKQTVNNHCKSLFKKGWIETIESYDKREKQLCLTPSGRAFSKPIIDTLTQVEQLTLTKMGKETFQYMFQYIQDYRQYFKASIATTIK